LARDTQGVDGMSGKLVTQPSLPGSAMSAEDQMGKVIQASGGMKLTNRDTMRLVDHAKVPGKEPYGKSR